MKIKPNHHVSVLIVINTIAAENYDVDKRIYGERSRKKLDSHSNMVVVGQHTSIISNIGRTAKVSTFTMGYESFQKIPIVDADIIYMCTYTENLISLLLVIH